MKIAAAETPARRTRVGKLLLPPSVNVSSRRAGRACTAAGCRRAREGRSADSDDYVPSSRRNALNPAGAASNSTRPSPQTCFSGSRPGTARWTIKTVGAEAAVRRDTDAQSKVAAGEETGRAEVEAADSGALREGGGRNRRALDSHKRAPPTPAGSQVNTRRASPQSLDFLGGFLASSHGRHLMARAVRVPTECGSYFYHA